MVGTEREITLIDRIPCAKTIGVVWEGVSLGKADTHSYSNRV